MRQQPKEEFEDRDDDGGVHVTMMPAKNRGRGRFIAKHSFRIQKTNNPYVGLLRKP
jgi:hypothetical protein